MKNNLLHRNPEKELKFEWHGSHCQVSLSSKPRELGILLNQERTSVSKMVDTARHIFYREPVRRAAVKKISRNSITMSLASTRGPNVCCIVSECPTVHRLIGCLCDGNFGKYQVQGNTRDEIIDNLEKELRAHHLDECLIKFC